MIKSISYNDFFIKVASKKLVWISWSKNTGIKRTWEVVTIDQVEIVNRNRVKRDHWRLSFEGRKNYKSLVSDHLQRIKESNKRQQSIVGPE